jgi:hypothetical protein
MSMKISQPLPFSSPPGIKAPRSEKLYVHNCTALTVQMCPGIPPSNPRLTRVERDISGVIGGELKFQIRLKLAYGHRGWAFLCPECQKRSFLLYFPPRSTNAACRACLNLSYRH